MTALLVVFSLLLVACDSPNTLLDTMDTVESSLPISLNDGDVFAITNPNPDLVTITWESNNEDLIDSNGNVFAMATDQTVTITITFEFGDKTESIDYDIIINKKDVVVDTTLADVKTDLTVVAETEADIVLPTLIDGVAISWSSDNVAISDTGIVTRDTVDIEVSLTATLTYNDETDTKVFTVIVKALEVPDTTLADVKADLTIITETENNLELPTLINGVAILWSSDNTAISDSGVVTRAELDVTVTLTATLSYESETDTKTFTVVVKALEVEDTTLADVKANLTVVTETENNLELPTLIDGVAISWRSDNVAINDSGIVTQTYADINVTLTATLTYNDETEEKSFTVTVLAMVDDEAPTLVALSPLTGEVLLDENEAFILVIEASDPNLFSLELDHNLSHLLPEFTVYANQLDPYGSIEDENAFIAAGVTVTYNELTQTWTIDFGNSVTTTMIDNDGVTFYMVIKDTFDNQFGSMDPTTVENTFTFDLKRIDESTPQLEQVTLTLSEDETYVSWNDIEGATFNLFVNDVAQSFTDNQFILPTEPGIYEIKVTASLQGYIGTEDTFLLEIEPAAAVQLDTPTNLVVDESGNLTWDLVSNATGYSILVEGQDAFDVEMNAFDLNTLELATGNYIITVVAKGDDILFLDSIESTSVTFEVESAELTQLPAPVNGISHTASTMHVAVGVYDGGTGYSGQLRFVWFDKVTNEPVASDLFNAPASQGYAYLYESFLETLPAGTYIVRFQAVGDQVLGSDSEFSIHTFEVTKALPVLDDPVITLNETTASWNAVVNATSYEVYVNDVLQTEGIINLSFALPTEVGVYTIKVVALADGYQSSEADAEHIVVSEEAVKLDAPANLVIDEETSVLSWNAVDHAFGYRIILGTNIIDLELVLSYDLSLILVSSGDHTVEVYALGDGQNYLNSEKAEITYTAPEPAQQLLPITAGAILVANDPGHYFFLFHNNPAGQEMVNQEGWNGEFLIKVMQGDTVILTIDDISFVAFGAQIRLHWGGKPGNDNFTGLPDGQYTISIQLVADGYMASDPYTYTLTW